MYMYKSTTVKVNITGDFFITVNHHIKKPFIINEVQLTIEIIIIKLAEYFFSCWRMPTFTARIIEKGWSANCARENT